MVALPRPRFVGRRGLEPRVLIGGVIRHDVEQHPDSQLVRFGDQCLRLCQSAVSGFDLAIVGDVIAGVGHRRRIPGVDPDRVDTQLRQVRQTAPQPCDIADAVAVSVGEAADVDLVHDGGLPPRGIGGGHGTPSVLDERASTVVNGTTSRQLRHFRHRRSTDAAPMRHHSAGVPVNCDTLVAEPNVLVVALVRRISGTATS